MSFYPPLAPYASNPLASKGRLLTEASSPTRTDFHRDRDRIIHSNAFKRLKDKTQVFIATDGDHFRTRLTHTLEVAQIARSLSRALGLDEDLAETLALAHDLGHPPFGHAGEDALNALVPFDHNVQTFRIVTKLEKRYATFDGLNLTYETLEGLVKHNGPLANPPQAFLNYKLDLRLSTYASLEAQAAAIADDIAYNSHDIEDGLRSGLLTFEDLREANFTAEILSEINALYPQLDEARKTYELSRRVITRMVEDVIHTAKANLAAREPKTIEDIRLSPTAYVDFSVNFKPREKQLKKLLFNKLYRHEQIMQLREKSEIIVAKLFNYYSQNPSEGLETPRQIADYISGMTDSYAIAKFKALG